MVKPTTTPLEQTARLLDLDRGYLAERHMLQVQVLLQLVGVYARVFHDHKRAARSVHDPSAEEFEALGVVGEYHVLGAWFIRGIEGILRYVDADKSRCFHNFAFSGSIMLPGTKTFNKSARLRF